jgi:hypothetical protein
MLYLTKSDFKAARECATKLFYRKLGYPSRLKNDEYLKFLADGGYMVERIAQLLHEHGREVEVGPDGDAFAATMRELAVDTVTLFGAMLRHGQFQAEVDILEKRGNEFRLIEVKAKSIDSNEKPDNPFRGKKGRISSEWIPYLEDVAFQTMILRRLFPTAVVTSWLCLVDKAITANSESTFEKFEMSERPSWNDSFRKPKITFHGDVTALRDQSFVRAFDVSNEVAELMPEVEATANRLAATLVDVRAVRLEPRRGRLCKACEYRGLDVERSGFRECWGELGEASPHLLDLFRVDQLGDGVIEEMISQGRTRLVDVAIHQLSGAFATAQRIQIECSANNIEFVDPELRRILGECNYPLQFIDFEATRVAVPYHAGMRPYGQIAFQWSCHTIPSPGGELQHSEWINLEDAYPNFEFARTLREVINPEGTIFVWSNFERSTLKDVREQMERFGERDETLAAWLDMITRDGGPIVDLYKLAQRYYYHPSMRGSHSIKQVLPAVWLHDETLRAHPWFANYVKDGTIVDPYETLEPLLFEEDGTEEQMGVYEGTAAIRTYQHMMFGLGKSEPELREGMKELLLNYCKLDTAAMVMIWMHWMASR